MERTRPLYDLYTTVTLINEQNSSCPIKTALKRDEYHIQNQQPAVVQKKIRNFEKLSNKFKIIKFIKLTK